MSAGCAIGLGNVWRFPYITGVYGGGAFVLLYLFFLLILGLPIIVMEFAVGRGSQKSIAKSFNELEPKGSKWHIYRYFGIAGNYLLMMFYTTIGGWMLAYFVKMVKGDFVGADTKQVEAIFGELTSNRNEMLFWMILISVLGLIDKIHDVQFVCNYVNIGRSCNDTGWCGRWIEVLSASGFW